MNREYQPSKELPKPVTQSDTNLTDEEMAAITQMMAAHNAKPSFESFQALQDYVKTINAKLKGAPMDVESHVRDRALAGKPIDVDVYSGVLGTPQRMKQGPYKPSNLIMDDLMNDPPSNMLMGRP